MLNASYSPATPENVVVSEQIKLKPKVEASLKLDRMTLLVPIHPIDNDAVLKHLITEKMHGGADGIVPAGWKAKTGSYIAFHVKVPTSTNPLIWSKDNAAVVQLKVKGSGKYLRVEIFPLGLTSAGFTHLFDELFLGTLFLHPSEMKKARISRVDLALDLRGVRLQDFAWHMPSRSVVRPYVSKGVLRTLYLGSSKHGAPCIYDKGHQMKVPDGEAWTRVELRPKLNLPLGTLPTLQNPFSAITPMDVMAAFAVVNPGELCRRHALSHSQLLGVRHLLQTVPDVKPAPNVASARQRLRQALEASVPSWWTPDLFWASWPEALATAMPPLFGSC